MTILVIKQQLGVRSSSIVYIYLKQKKAKLGTK